MYIEFYNYPPYSVAISKKFETNMNSNIQFDHGYPYSEIKSTKVNMLTWINK